jgi:hypothetical protein
MAQYTLTGTFGTSFENSDTVLLSVNSGTISPTSTTKGALAAGLNVQIDDGVTVTAVANSGACSSVIAQVVAGTAAPTPPPPAADSYDCNTRIWATASWNSGTGAVTLTPSANTTIHSYSPTNISANSGEVFIEYTFSNSEAGWDNTDAQIAVTDPVACYMPSIDTGATLEPFGPSQANFNVADGVTGATIVVGTDATVSQGTLVSVSPSVYGNNLNNYVGTITPPASGYSNSGGANITDSDDAIGSSTTPTGSFSGSFSGFTPGDAGEYAVNVTSNVAWSLALKGSDTTHFTLDVVSGNPGTSVVTMSYDGSNNWDINSNVSVILKSTSPIAILASTTVDYSN